MKCETYLTLTRDEVNKMIPYAIVCETMSGVRWDTGKRKRLMREQFTESERKAVSELHKQARTWYLVKGVPDEVKITPHRLCLWTKLANFCCQL